MGRAQPLDAGASSDGGLDHQWRSPGQGESGGRCIVTSGSITQALLSCLLICPACTRSGEGKEVRFLIFKEYIVYCRENLYESEII